MAFLKQHILIAGGAGFIGSHFCEYFLNKGFQVTAVDNLLTGQIVNIEPFLKHPQFHFLNHDVIKPLTVERPVSAVANLASPASPVDYQKFPLETLRVGAEGTLNLLNLALAKKARFLMASTSEVYGDPLQHPQQESYWGNVNPVGIRSCYDEAKRYSESLTMTFHRQYGLSTYIARIFNTYGPRMRLDDGRALPNFLGQALRRENLTVYGDGSQTRSFCYVSDLISGLEKLLFSEEHFPVNLGNPKELSLLEFAKTILKLVPTSSEIVFKELPADDPKVRRPDITRAKSLLGWEPKISLEEGLRLTIPYFSNLLQKR